MDGISGHVFRGTTRVFVTRLNPAECESRLRSHVAARFALRPSVGHPVRGTVSAQRFTIRPFIGYRNGYQTEAIGNLAPDNGGTRITVVFRTVRLSVIATAGLMLAFAAYAALIGLEALPVVTAAIGLLAGIAAFGRWLARDDVPVLTRFLEATLAARELRTDT